ncbi:hypothetical protein JTE88_03460 [Arcanobacterium phocisimile]|uniref:PKD domain-containing protein n=1 Tax=Arcanobacterium phocisimile TaxID=1302235 RepID=A0ABX7IJU0_9ACTO|nr:hypothetical protein [Arcanobacterium phocisimile]QRV02799.1 hypothetical protein JTE88_03460 [Arcanobacterium phocisimile]
MNSFFFFLALTGTFSADTPAMTEGDRWGSSVTDNIVEVGMVVPINSYTRNDSDEVLPPDLSAPTFVPPRYTISDFCAGIPVPGTVPVGWGIGNLGELESRREEICAADMNQSLTLEAISTAFQDQASTIIDAGEFHIQPETTSILINKDTYFSSTAVEHTTMLTVAEQEIPIKITPQSYHWQFGDGEEQITSTGGRGWPDGQIRHPYHQQGTYRPTVVVAWSAVVRLPSGTWIQVPGTGYTQSTGREFTVREARAVLTYRTR